MNYDENPGGNSALLLGMGLAAAVGLLWWTRRARAGGAVPGLPPVPAPPGGGASADAAVVKAMFPLLPTRYAELPRLLIVGEPGTEPLTSAVAERATAGEGEANPVQAAVGVVPPDPAQIDAALRVATEGGEATELVLPTACLVVASDYAGALTAWKSLFALRASDFPPTAVVPIVGGASGAEVERAYAQASVFLSGNRALGLPVCGLVPSGEVLASASTAAWGDEIWNDLHATAPPGARVL